MRCWKHGLSRIYLIDYVMNILWNALEKNKFIPEGLWDNVSPWYPSHINLSFDFSKLFDSGTRAWSCCVVKWSDTSWRRIRSWIRELNLPTTCLIIRKKKKSKMYVIFYKLDSWFFVPPFFFFFFFIPSRFGFHFDSHWHRQVKYWVLSIADITEKYKKVEHHSRMRPPPLG